MIDRNQKKPMNTNHNPSNNGKPIAVVRNEDNGDRDRERKNLSITQILLTRLYGENLEEIYSHFVTNGGWVIVGANCIYDEINSKWGESAPVATWGYYGWDNGAVVRFDSEVDAIAFLKTINLPNKKGVAYSRPYIPRVMCTNGLGAWETDDDALPHNEYAEDNKDND